MIARGAIGIGAPLLLCAALSAAQTGTAPQSETLAPGARVDRRLASGEVHRFRIQVPEGRFVNVRVEQRGIDAVVSLLDGDGALLRRHDSPCADLDVESVSFVAPRTGWYGLQVSSFDPQATPGAYLLTLDGPRAPRREDLVRIAAEKAIESSGFDQGTARGFAGAASRFAESARLFAPIDPIQEAIALYGAASAEDSIGRTDQARLHLERSLALAKAHGDRALEALALGRIAFRSFQRDGRSDSLEPLRQAIALFANLPSPRDLAGGYANLAYFHWLQGHYEEALTENEEGLRLARSAGARFPEAIFLKNLAQVYLSLGLPRQALPYGEEALQTISGVSEGLRVQGHVLTALGRIWLALDDPQRSRDYLESALALRRRLGDREGEAEALLEIARVDRDRGDQSAARDAVQTALSFFREVGNAQAQIRALLLAGSVDALRGDAAGADREAETAASLAREIGDRFGEAGAEFALARGARERGDLDLALAQVERALAASESLRSEIPGEELRASFAASVQDGYRLRTDLLIDLDLRSPGRGFAERAFEAAEKARARSMAEAVAQGRLGLDRRVPEALRVRERDVSAHITFLQRRLSEAPSAERNRWSAELTQSEQDFDRLVGEIRTDSPRLAALRYPRPATAGESRALLAPDQAMVAYTVLEKSVVAFLLTPARLDLVTLPADAALLPVRAANFLELLSRGDPDDGELAKRLSADLLEPLRPRLGRDVRRLVIVPDSSLPPIPFEALPWSVSGSPGALLERFAVSYAPSATVLAALTARGTDSGGSRPDLMAFADPGAGLDRGAGSGDTARGLPGGPGTSERIPGTRREIRAIARYASRGTTLYVGAEASEVRAKSENLGRYRILHFATHGFPDAEGPGRASLLLAATPGREDGLLQAREISALDLDNDLVVLSGCQTAAGSILAGEGVQSLARAFFLAGARSVVASLWKVRDDATAELMTAFYRRLASGDSKEEALRGAKLELMRARRTSSPRDWAAFVLMGEASGRIPLTPRPVRTMTTVAIVAVALLLPAGVVLRRRRGRRI